MNRRPRTLISREHNGLPRTYRLGAPTRDAAYRRLAVAILGLDVTTLASELSIARRALEHRTALATAPIRLARAA